ncbi:hypothetical protein GCM10023167_25230 [Brevibacterium pityocampae]|uniref:Uncharacterized protein n=1 Tax=Brevibacterium pityocampae TaxID=506594 RepID=A0ABP8JS10_9MICO
MDVVEGVQRPVAGGAEVRFEPLALEHDADHLRECGVVVHYQNPSVHGAHSSPLVPDCGIRVPGRVADRASRTPAPTASQPAPRPGPSRAGVGIRIPAWE